MNMCCHLLGWPDWNESFSSLLVGQHDELISISCSLGRFVTDRVNGGLQALDVFTHWVHYIDHLCLKIMMNRQNSIWSHTLLSSTKSRISTEFVYALSDLALNSENSNLNYKAYVKTTLRPGSFTKTQHALRRLEPQLLIHRPPHHSTVRVYIYIIIHTGK